jgi:protoporphyrinogen oxidase
MKKTALIIGAGPAGLTAALELLRRSDITPIVLEADTQVGGISRTVNHLGNRIDIGGHRFFSKSDWVMNWWKDILPVQTESAGAVRIAYQNKSREIDVAPVTGGCRAYIICAVFSITRSSFRQAHWATWDPCGC